LKIEFDWVHWVYGVYRVCLVLKYLMKLEIIL